VRKRGKRTDVAEQNHRTGSKYHNKDTATHGQSTPVDQQHGRSECSCMRAYAVQHMLQAICYEWVAARKEAGSTRQIFQSVGRRRVVAGHTVDITCATMYIERPSGCNSMHAS
jgi:hypothetical protein